MTDAAKLTPEQVKAHIGDATGELGFLKWVETLPASISVPVLKVAAMHAAQRATGIPNARLSGLGDAAQDAIDQSASLADLTSSTPAATTVASSTPASSSWLSDIANVLTQGISAAGQAYLTVNQVHGANQILQTNLQRAQQGLPPLPYTASDLGLTGPTVNLGVSSSTLKPILWLGGGALVLIALTGALKARR